LTTNGSIGAHRL